MYQICVVSALEILCIGQAYTNTAVAKSFLTYFIEFFLPFNRVRIVQFQNW